MIAFTVEEALNESTAINKVATHFASESVLSKGWLTAEEDKAWQDL